MKYSYTDINDVQINITFSLNDVQRLRDCVRDFEPEEHKWMFKQFKETLKESELKAAEAMDLEARHIKRENKDETN
jgi:hypothetical protein